MTLASFYAVLVGIGMIGQWSVAMTTRRAPELKTEPFRIAYHLAGRFLTAIALVAAGSGLFTHAPWARSAQLVSDRHRPPIAGPAALLTGFGRSILEAGEVRWRSPQHPSRTCAVR